MDILPFVVGVTDATKAFITIVIGLSQKWNVFTSEIVDKPFGGILASVLYIIGSLVLAISTIGPSLSMKLILYIIGSLVMSRGTSLIWSITSQVIKDHGKHQIDNQILREREMNEENMLMSKNTDVDAKISQIQVLFRFAASAVGPIFATRVLLQNLSASNSYLGLAFLVCCLCTFLILTVRRIHHSNQVDKEDDHDNRIEIGWREVLPAWFQQKICCCCFSSIGSGRSTIDTETGYFNAAWVDCGLLNGLTEVVRSGYERILCLRALSMGLSSTQLAHVLAITGATAVATFWLSDIADRNRRLASFLSFFVLGLGHFGLGMSTSFNGVLISAFLFGIGEGMSTGLRDLHKKDYRHSKGPLGDMSRLFISKKLDLDLTKDNSIFIESEAKVLRRKVQGLASPWADWCGILNSIAVGIIGRYCGMRFASFTYASIAAFAVYISIAVIPDSRPPFVLGKNDLPMWKNWLYCNRKTPTASYVALQPMKLIYS
eukprot:CAMPEP_0170065778 /NCGR_PEP_ID=MMETSP0019_2-20121128/5734_1 /TAXON_ID=98059 /ORGANISM="Dinobryon sp., Strain UTEXLB2267" /LENGTH=488 /DNA_ID=CAMNT_0010272725 /DNA_START=166 /DNA_END=1632 /DNA_ORIENTATION=+